MSSAILYLAIVTIWAVVLVPRWLRGTHAADHASRAPDAGEAPAGDRAAGWEAPGGSVPVADGSTGTAGAGEAPLAHQPAPAHLQDEDELAPAPAGERIAPHPERAASRARILQARRRTLFTLVALTAGAIGIALINVAAWWVAIPPCVMLAGFIALLRAAAEIDSERARDHARARHAAQRRTGTAGTPSVPAPAVPDAAAAGGPAEGTGYGAAAGAPGPLPDEVAAATGTDGGPPDRYAWEEPEPGAEVIDISGRVGDQFYDQYSDAAARAIGD
ncbi:MAG: hypothetical protein LBI49_00660 [Nocardiopsaceae bacterium]|nr:hypothetical protein [Nocardiopsaceae bacterium]